MNFYQICHNIAGLGRLQTKGSEMNSIKSLSIGALALILSGNLFALPIKQVAITSIVEHPALDSVRKGVEDELKAQGYIVGKNLKLQYQSAQGNNATAAQIAKKYVGDKPDVIVGIGTPSAQALAASTRTIPIVFSAVTDPVAAKLIRSWSATGGNVTGVSDMLPLGAQIDLIKKVVPAVKNVGFVYSPGEVNSTTVLKQLKIDLAKQNIKLIAAPAQQTTAVPTAVRSLKGKVEVIYNTTDNNVVSAYESMYQAAVQNKIPLVSADTASVKRGAVAALGTNYYDMGRQTGKMVVRILKGEKVGAIAAQKPQKTDLVVNPDAAKKQGVTLAPALIKSAKEVVKMK